MDLISDLQILARPMKLKSVPIRLMQALLLHFQVFTRNFHIYVFCHHFTKFVKCICFLLSPNGLHSNLSNSNDYFMILSAKFDIQAIKYSPETDKCILFSHFMFQCPRFAPK